MANDFETIDFEKLRLDVFKTFKTENNFFANDLYENDIFFYKFLCLTFIKLTDIKIYCSC